MSMAWTLPGSANKKSRCHSEQSIFPEHGNIQIHQRRIQLCGLDFPAGFYWYGGRSVGPGHPPEWVNKLLAVNLPPETRNQTQSNVNLSLDDITKNVPDHVEPSESCKEKSHLMELTMSKNKIMNRDIMILVSVGTQEVPREQRTCTRTVVPPPLPHPI